MANIETVFDDTQDLGIYTVTGEIILQQLLDAMQAGLNEKRTSLVLWDFRKGRFMDMSSSEVQRTMGELRPLAIRRGSGRTAFVVSSDVEFGVGRTLEAFLEMEDLSVNVRFFRDMPAAREWLGLTTYQHDGKDAATRPRRTTAPSASEQDS